LQALRAQDWVDLYHFTLEPHYHIDYVVANHYTSTHPDSSFVQRLVAARPGTESRVTLRNRQLFEQTPEGITESTVLDDDALLEVLRSRFGLEFPAGTRFGYRD
jgi:N-hydroxyarylamine O-acetyltransferase